MAKSITEIDRNMAIETVDDIPVQFFNVLDDPFAVYGLCDPHDGQQFHRIPAEIAHATNDGVAWLYLHTAGGRAGFKTDSPYVAVKVKVKNVGLITHMALVGSSGLDVYIRQENGYRFHDICRTEGCNDAPTRIAQNGGFTNIVHLPEGMNDVLLNFPLYGEINELWIGVKPGSAIEASKPYRDLLPTVYYGSSITQGGCANRPGNHYPHVLSRKYNVDFRVLGFSGSARGEQVISDYVAAQPMSAFVFAYDHNAPTVEHLAATHEPMYLNVRASHPDIPVVFITRPKLNYTPDEVARRKVVKATYEHAKARGENVYFVDGEPIFDILGGDACTADGVHPNDLGFACVAAALDPVFADIYGE